MGKFWNLTAKEAVAKIAKREITAKELTSSIFERIKSVDSKIHSYVKLTEQLAMKQAAEVDNKIAKGNKVGRLAGVPIAIKDVICTEDVVTTCSSRMLKDFIPPYNATVIDKLIEEDAIIIGKTNTDEFAMGVSTETSYFGPTLNPWNPLHVPGGSSGGSGAAVAADETILALGSDTGGSVRCPASFCSVVGLKPTYGLVSRYGLIAYANSLEQIGPITKNVYDCALLLSVIAGYDPSDSTSANLPSKNYTTKLTANMRGLKIGVPQEFFGQGTDKKVAKTVRDGIE
ncbi:MAG TPA: amidase family protein, partial [archaeon]|nr:amidase family protein [archaeon]